MMPDEIARVHDKIDKLLEQGIRTETRVIVIEDRMSEYQRPCKELVVLVDERNDKKKFWNGLKSKVATYSIFGLICMIATAVVFAVKNGWTP